MPWLYVRERLAQRWNCRPRDIDPVEDADEIGITLEIMGIEAKYSRYSRDDGED